MFKLKIFEDLALYFEKDFNKSTEILVGRGSSCDIVLEGHPGISREHLKIKIEEDGIKIELISTSGKLIYQGQNIGSYEIKEGGHTLSIPPYDLKFDMGALISENVDHLDEEEGVESIDEKKEEVKEDDSTSEDFESNQGLALRNVEEEGSGQLLESHSSTEEVEKTCIAVMPSLSYYLKVFKKDNLQQELLIEGDQWTFGRDPKSDYRIRSKKASRKHFSILKMGSSFYVKDLGASNGTFLNKQQLPTNQEIELKSGDYIEVDEFKFIFEIQDNQFTDKLKEVALIEEYSGPESIEELRSQALVLSDETLKLSSKNSSNVLEKDFKVERTKKIRVLMLSLIILLGVGYFYQNQNNPTASVDVASREEKKRSEKERVNAALDRFNLALRFYNESQFERCLLEVDEFLKYDIKTEATSGAMELRNQCDIEKERLQRQKDMLLQKEKRLAIDQKVEEIVEACAKVVSEGIAALNACVAPALDLDPANEGISQLVDQAEAASLKLELDAKARKKYQRRLAAGLSLFNKAKKYNENGRWKKSIRVYNKFISSSYPDPKGLRKKAKRNIASIRAGVNLTLEKALSKSEKFLSDGDYKQSILEANEGLKVNRDHVKLLETKGKAQKYLKTILRKYYQESIIEEDFGQIDEAKIKWKKIIKLGVKGSDYYMKAQSKLKYYEEGV